VEALVDHDVPGLFENKNTTAFSHVDELVKSGATGSGEFISCLISVFGPDADSISYLGQWLVAFHVPLERSHYTYSTKCPDRTISYHGSLLVDPATAELKRVGSRI